MEKLKRVIKDSLNINLKFNDVKTHSKIWVQKVLGKLPYYIKEKFREKLFLNKTYKLKRLLKNKIC